MLRKDTSQTSVLVNRTFQVPDEDTLEEVSGKLEKRCGSLPVPMWKSNKHFPVFCPPTLFFPLGPMHMPIT